MWYVIQVEAGHEDSIAKICRDSIGKPGEDAFVPRYERKQNFRGHRRTITRVLFPGYVFFRTDDAEDLFFRLKRVTALTNILRTGEDFTPLYPQEELFLTRLGLGEPEHLAFLSVGYLEGETVVVTKGPLRDLEARIRRLNRHRCEATLEVEIFGRVVETTVGLEIVERRPARTGMGADAGEMTDGGVDSPRER